MKQKIFLLLVLCFASFTSCGKAPPDRHEARNRPTVLVSSLPYVYFTKLIAGSTVQVECLTPPGTNPHLFEIPPKQVQKILHSSLWLRLGEPMEKKFLDIFRSQNSHLRIVDLSEGIALLDLPHSSCNHCHHDSQDRHFWMSPSIAKQQLAKIAETLMDMYPEHSDAYRANLALGQELLTQIDSEIHSLLAQARPGAILISHPALGYFCRDYGIEQLAIETEGKDPLPSDLAALMEKTQKKNISAVLLLPQHNNQGALRIADLLHLPVQTIDPYAVDYPEGMRAIAEAIAHPAPTSTASRTYGE